MEGRRGRERAVIFGAAFVRVSTGSQDESSQVREIDEFAAGNGVTIVKTFRLHGYSASGGMQEPALLEAVADIERGDYSALVVTDSSRLDRREDLDAQAGILLAIRRAGGDVMSVAEPQFGKTDFAGRIVTLVAQQANAEKSRKVKDDTYRGVRVIRDNGAHVGALPVFWERRGERYGKQAFCADPAAVADVYERVAAGESLASVGRAHAGGNGGKALYPQSIRTLIRFAAHHTGVIECRYTHAGQTDTWTHEVQPVVDSALWWRANRVLEDNSSGRRANRGGRPVASPANWISGVLDCPQCGGKVFLVTGLTPATDYRTGLPRPQKPRPARLRCGGTARDRLSCKRFTPIDAPPVTALIAAMFAADQTGILAFQRVAGNAHELDALHAGLRKIQARLSATDDDDELDALVAERKAVKARIEGFAVVPDRYDYAPTGQTVARMWNDGDDKVRRGMVRAVKNSLGMALTCHEGRWGITLGAAGSAGAGDGDAIVDLGNGLCFRRQDR
jgi:DNA invertase Pin-like site-specific DNA recombinase